MSGEVLRHAAAGGPPPDSSPPVMPAGYASVPFNSLLDEARRRLLEIGINPGGPQPSVAKYRPRIRGALPVRWEALFDWDRAPRSYRQGLQPVEQHLRDLIEDSLRKSIIQDVLFAAGSRDFESLNLGLLWIDGNGPASVEEQATGSVMLAQRRRWTGSMLRARLQPPSHISNYLVAVALRAGQNPITLQTDVETRLTADHPVACPTGDDVRPDSSAPMPPNW